MSDSSDKILKLLIDMNVVGKEDVAAANELLRDTAKATGDAGNATDDLKNKQDEASDSAEKLHFNHRALHQIMHLIGNETAPGLGRALTGALYGPIGFALAAGYAFENLREQIAKTNEELDGIGARAAEAFSNVKANLFDALRNEKFSTEKVDAFFRHIGEQSDVAKKKIEDALALFRAEKSAQEEKNKADEANEVEFIKKKYAGASAGAKGEDLAAIKQQEEDEINAVKDRWARINAILKVQGEQAGVDAAAAIYHNLQGELDKLLFKRGPAPMTDEQKATQAANTKDKEVELANMQKRLGLDEQTGLPSGEGDAKHLADLKAKYADELERLNGRVSQYNALLENKNLSESERFNFTMLRDAFQRDLNGLNNASGIDQAQAAVEQDKVRIEQLKDQVAQLKLTTDSEKKLQEEIDKLTIKVQQAQEAMNQSASIAGTKADATFYTTDKNAQHGKDIGRVEGFAPASGSPSLDTLMTALHYSESQKLIVVEKILGHAYTSLDAWKKLEKAVDGLNSQSGNSRDRTAGGS